jgi:hypothetical protein
MPVAVIGERHWTIRRNPEQRLADSLGEALLRIVQAAGAFPQDRVSSGAPRRGRRSLDVLVARVHCGRHDRL